MSDNDRDLQILDKIHEAISNLEKAWLEAKFIDEPFADDLKNQITYVLFDLIKKKE